ncbi:hypothetical protein ABNQ39_22585 [Azospirillum sp. A26]|uniref:hypothetical protein n=1 Tax=Azospirillum sp. A26 TaxID=3160607 RepID=UPI00366DE5DA
MGIRLRILFFAAVLAAIAVAIGKGNIVVQEVNKFIHSLKELSDTAGEPWIKEIFGLSHQVKLFDEKNNCASDSRKNYYLNGRTRQSETFCIRANDGWVLENPRTEFICNDQNSKGDWRHNYPYGQSSGFNAEKTVYCDLIWAIGNADVNTAGYAQIYATTRMKDPYGPVYRISIAIVILIGFIFLVRRFFSKALKKYSGKEPEI